MAEVTIHAVSIHPGPPETVCGRVLDGTVVATGFGRPSQQVCPHVTCNACLQEMGIRLVTNDWPGYPADNT